MDTSPRIYDAVMAALDSRRIPQKIVAEGSGVPFSTVSKIAQRSVKDPSVHTVQRLYDYFQKLLPIDVRRGDGRREEGADA